MVTLVAKKDGKESTAGQLIVLPNNITKNVYIAFIPVNIDAVTGGAKIGEKDKTKQLFNQAYINAKTETSKAITVEGKWFNFWFTKEDKTGNKILTTSNWLSIHNYIDNP